MTNNSTQIIYDMKITRENIINKGKSLMNVKIIENFLHFFGFPPSMGYRQYCNLVENAVNNELKFIYFFTFRVLDESGNGFITISDLFRFMQNFNDNPYVEEEIYMILREIKNLNKK
jgi:hypothetical protein